MEKTIEVALTGIEAAKSAQKIVEDFRSDTERLFHSENDKEFNKFLFFDKKINEELLG
jgi:hypothetical protein